VQTLCSSDQLHEASAQRHSWKSGIRAVLIKLAWRDCACTDIGGRSLHNGKKLFDNRRRGLMSGAELKWYEVELGLNLGQRVGSELLNNQTVCASYAIVCYSKMLRARFPCLSKSMVTPVVPVWVAKGGEQPFPALLHDEHRHEAVLDI
jgi:hypothetical protein